MHICVGDPTIIGLDNGLSPDRRQAIIWTNAGMLLIGPLGTNFNEILIGIQAFSFERMHWKCRLRNGVHFLSASATGERASSGLIMTQLIWKGTHVLRYHPEIVMTL